MLMIEYIFPAYSFLNLAPAAQLWEEVVLFSKCHLYIYIYFFFINTWNLLTLTSWVACWYLSLARSSSSYTHVAQPWNMLRVDDPG